MEVRAFQEVEAEFLGPTLTQAHVASVFPFPQQFPLSSLFLQETPLSSSLSSLSYRLHFWDPLHLLYLLACSPLIVWGTETALLTSESHASHKSWENVGTLPL